MRRLVAAAALLALAFVPAPADGAAAGYSHPANAGVHHPFGAPVAVEATPLSFQATQTFTQFYVEAHDWAKGPVWIHVCLFYANVCIGSGEGNDRVTIDAPPGAAYPAYTVARVYVYSAHAWADGEVSLATWGGVRAQFNPSGHLHDAVPYLASGYAGLVMGVPVNLRFGCGDLVSAQCVTTPIATTGIRVRLVDDARVPTQFEVCVGNRACVPATNEAQLAGAPIGTSIDIRPYNVAHNSVVGTKGHVLLTYST